MAEKKERKPREKKPVVPLVLSGRVFCDWNCFTMMSPRPDSLRRGDLIVWSWSGTSKDPKSLRDVGLLRVSVFDGKARKTLKVKRTNVHQHLKYDSESQRESKLSALLPELRELSGRELVKAEGGFEVAPLPAPPPTRVSTPEHPARAVQGTLFD